MVQSKRFLARAFFSFLLICAAVFASAQDTKTTVTLPPAPLLPASFGPWQSDPAATVEPFQPQGEAAAVFTEAGLVRSSQKAFHRAEGSETMNVEAYQFTDATGAFSAFTYLRGLKGTGAGALDKADGMETVSGPGGEFLAWHGSTVVRAVVSRVRPTTKDELNELAQTLPKITGPKAHPPVIPRYLPEKGLIQDSLRYALGPAGYKAMGGTLPADLLGFDKAAEVLAARYDGQGTLTLLMLPTPQIAADRGRALADWLTQQGAAAGTVKLRREGTLLILATGPWTPEAAKAMVEDIHPQSELTWNRPVPLNFFSEVHKTVSLLTAIAIFCGLGALAAILLGFFLGGGRALVRVMQGKPAATEPEFLRIDLGGSVEQISTGSTDSPGSENPPEADPKD